MTFLGSLGVCAGRLIRTERDDTPSLTYDVSGHLPSGGLDPTSPTMPKFPPLSVPSPSQPLSKHTILRNAAITLVSLTLAALWIALGPHGDFLDGRAFSVSTLDQVTYVFYNWSITLPLDQTTQYRFQAYNNRLVGKTSFVAVDSERRLGDPNGIFVSIETTASPAQFSFRRQTLPGLLACDIVVSGELFLRHLNPR
jgi:hypothetical protein